MSITFSQYSAENPAKAGYFRLGHVVFQVPPVDIKTGKATNNERFTALRGQNDMFKKTGQSRMDFTVSWVALTNDAAADETGRLLQWEDLRTILAIFHAAPFVEVENGYLRQVLSEKDATMTSARMGFALRTLLVSTHNDIVDALDVSLTMTLFNYFPYSNDFGYMGDHGQSVDAWQSTSFKTYIDNWKKRNLDGTPIKDPKAHLTPAWTEQPDGSVKLTWREYITVRVGTAVAIDPNTAASAESNVTGGDVTKSNANISGTGQYDALIQKYAAQYGLSAAMVKAVVSHESSFRPAIMNSEYRGKPTDAGSSSGQVITNFRSHLTQDADGGLAFMNRYIQQNGVAPGIGLMQLEWPTAKWMLPSCRPCDLLSPESNLNIGCKYLAYLYSQGMTDQTIYWYNAGPDKKGKKNNATEQEYTKTVLALRDQYSVNSQATAAPAATSTSVPSTFTADSMQTPGFEDSMTDSEKQYVQSLLDAGYRYDHRANRDAFFFKERSMALTDTQHGDGPNIFSMLPQGFSVVFSNNLAQIPLAAYQYPTYQHIGSTSARVNLMLMSKGERDSLDQEPNHFGLQTLSAAAEFMEAQYLRYRSSWRAVSSVHGMQAFWIDNKILNMLGLRAVLIEGISSAPIPNSSDMTQVQVIANQYENIFEVSDSYKIQTIDSTTTNTAKTIYQSGDLGSLTPDEANQLSELAPYSAGRAAGNLTALEPYLLKLGKLASVNFNLFDQLGTVTVAAADATTLLKPYTSGANMSGYTTIATRIATVVKSNSFTAGDIALLSAIGSTAPSSDDSILSYFLIPSTNASAAPDMNASRAAAKRILTTAQVQAVYDSVFNLLVSYDAQFASDINNLANSPKYKTQFNSTLTPQGPGLDAQNAGHGAYRDMGLGSITLDGADFNPGSYFVNHNADYLATVRSNFDGVINATSDTNAKVNAPVHPDAFDIAITEDFARKNLDTNSLMRMTNVPGYNMAEAFPTFKLFLIEDSGDGLIQGFDNFYSYASVLDIEVMKFLDKPDLARIQISNIANILQHKLFDNSSQGKWEYLQYSRQFGETTPGSSTPLTGGAADSALITGKTYSGQLYQTEGFDLSDGTQQGKVARIPLQYIALQPGTKIQVRMGYANNPDELFPVFTGRVESIEGDEILTLEAESYMAEMLELPVKDDKPVKDKKYGGWQPWHDAGDVKSVVQSLLRVDNLKHFGAFKLSTISQPLMSGFTWENRLGAMVGEFSLDPTNAVARIGAGAASGFDRSGENILINHVINHLGDVEKNRGKRDMWDESTTDLYTSFNYQIPDNCTKTTWELIRDICRRYPDYTVAVKTYGFPFNADATLVVGHPLDWYFARLPMIGDAERYRASQGMDAEFTQWMKAQGNEAWTAMLAQIDRDKTNDGILSVAARVSGNVPAPTTVSEFYSKLTALASSTQEFFGVVDYKGNGSGATPGGLLDYLDQKLEGLSSWVSGPSVTSKDKMALGEIQTVMRMWEAYVQQQNPQSDDRLKPVRRYHFIDHVSIVHNGMRVNDQIYNSIRIGSDTKAANGAIPSHYIRTLDVTDLLVDPANNVNSASHLTKAVQQSFLREELGKMYEGEIILRGIPEIEPGDALVIYDPSTVIVGLVDVDRVIQSFNQETGYTTIVYPRCITTVNEAASANMGRMFAMCMGKALGNFHGLTDTVSNMSNADRLSLGTIGGSVATTAVAGAALLGAPVWAALGGILAIGVFGGICYTGYKSETENMVEVMPVTRHGRPWIGGLQGYQIADFWQNLQNSFTAFKAENIYPLLDTYRAFAGSGSSTLPV